MTAATLIDKTKNVDASTLTDEEFTQVDEVLPQIIAAAIRIRSRLNT